MADPQQPEIRRDPYTGVTKVRADPSSPWMDFKDPNADAHPIGPTDDLDTFKNFMTGLGATAATLPLGEVGIPVRVGMAALGGGAGRVIAHGASAASGSYKQPSVGADFADGAGYGAGGEVLPTGVSALLGGGGNVAKWAASKLAGAFSSPWERGAAFALPGALAGLLEGGGTGAALGGGAAHTIGMASEPVLRTTGNAAAKAGDWIGPETTSMRMRRWLGLGETAGESPTLGVNPESAGSEVPGSSFPGGAAARGKYGPKGPTSPTPPAPEPPTPEDMPTSLRILPRKDEVWGPGSVDQEGGLAQADFSKANLKYDPQTPTSYIREQLAQEKDPAQQQFLLKALRQRQRLDRLPE